MGKICLSWPFSRTVTHPGSPNAYTQFKSLSEFGRVPAAFRSHSSCTCLPPILSLLHVCTIGVCIGIYSNHSGHKSDRDATQDPTSRVLRCSISKPRISPTNLKKGGRYSRAGRFVLIGVRLESVFDPAESTSTVELSPRSCGRSPSSRRAHQSLGSMPRNVHRRVSAMQSGASSSIDSHILQVLNRLPLTRLPNRRHAQREKRRKRMKKLNTRVSICLYLR